MGMFDTFSINSLPDNKHSFLPEEQVDEIVIGASCRHVFKIDCKYSEAVSEGSVIYRQGDFGFIIPITQDMVREDALSSIIIVTLSPATTLGFRRNGITAKCQLKLTMKTDGFVAYDDWHELKIYEGLDVTKFADNDLGVHLLAVNTDSANKVRIQMLDKTGKLLEETQDIIIGKNCDNSISAITVVDKDDKKQLKFEFTDSSISPLFCDLTATLEALKTELIEELKNL